jgi:hypothetical protein
MRRNALGRREPASIQLDLRSDPWHRPQVWGYDPPFLQIAEVSG